MTHGITIGQAAAFAGVTVKTVRHYHKQGLIEEPRRDNFGYRRYGSADLLRLVQVRTLAAAGVPLAEIGAILDADPDRFAQRARRRRTAPHRPNQRSGRAARHAAPTRHRRPGPAARPRSRAPGQGS